MNALTRERFARLTRSLIAAVVLTSATVMAPLAVGADATASPATTPASSYEWGPCPQEVPSEEAARVRCGTLTVPEARAGGSTSQRTIKLPVAVVPSRSHSPKPDPLVFPTAGGPGAGSLSSLWYFLDWADWATTERDVILVEQRGDQLARPTLNCPELDVEQQVVDGLFASERRPALEEATKACHDRLEREGIDLAAYTSSATAADLQDLRRALGYQKWNLYGISYGSRAALTAMRDQPEGLRAVILDGVYPPNGKQHHNAAGFSNALRALLSACSADEHCQARYPDLAASLTRVIERTRESPITVRTLMPRSREPVRLEISDVEVITGLQQALYDSNTIRVLPFIIDQMARGNDAVAMPLAQQQLEAVDYFTEGLWNSIDCTEEIPFYGTGREPAQDQWAAAWVAAISPATCADWSVKPLTDAEDMPVRSDIPTLILNGGHDPITPPAQGRAAASGLSHHYLFDIPTMGHGVVWQTWIDRCPSRIAQQFLDAPDRSPEASCIAAMPPIRFLTTDDIHPTPAMFDLNRDVIEARQPLQLGILGVAALCLFLGLGVGAAALVRWRRRRPPITMGAMLAASVLNLAYAAGLGWLVTHTDPLVLGFGVPASWRPVLAALAVLALAATVVLLLLVIRAWLRADGTRTERVSATVVAAGGTTLAAWLLLHGLVFI